MRQHRGVSLYPVSCILSIYSSDAIEYRRFCTRVTMPRPLSGVESSRRDPRPLQVLPGSTVPARLLRVRRPDLERSPSAGGAFTRSAGTRGCGTALSSCLPARRLSAGRGGALCFFCFRLWLLIWRASGIRVVMGFFSLPTRGLRGCRSRPGWGHGILFQRPWMA